MSGVKTDGSSNNGGRAPPGPLITSPVPHVLHASHSSHCKASLYVWPSSGCCSSPVSSHGRMLDWSARIDENTCAILIFRIRGFRWSYLDCDSICCAHYKRTLVMVRLCGVHRYSTRLSELRHAITEGMQLLTIFVATAAYCSFPPPNFDLGEIRGFNLPCNCGKNYRNGRSCGKIAIMELR